jgi:hypothetical protein
MIGATTTKVQILHYMKTHRSVLTKLFSVAMSSKLFRVALQLVTSFRRVCADPNVPCGFEIRRRNPKNYAALETAKNRDSQPCTAHSHSVPRTYPSFTPYLSPFVTAGVNAYLSIYGPGAADPYGLEQNNFFLRNFEEISRNSSNERFEEGAVFLPASTLSSFRVKKTTRVFAAGFTLDVRKNVRGIPVSVCT